MAEYKDISFLKKQIADFKRAVHSSNSDYLTGYVCALSATEGIVANLPDADVVEVVRCKDCKHSGMYAFGFGDTEELACLDIEEDGFIRFATAVDPDSFCSRGERKKDNG